MISEINSIFCQKNKIKPKDICICSFSGGQDSVLLFIILLHLKKQWNIEIQLLHFHHFWQQQNFFSVQQVWKLSFIFKNPFYIITSEVFLNTEKKARQWRQEGLERISFIEKSNKIVTGHTASDRIETAFWHLIRGTSPQGLISLKWQTILIVQTEFFSISKFFIFETTILCTYQFLLKIDNNTFKTSKFKFIYKKYKNKKILKNHFYSGHIHKSSAFNIFCEQKRKNSFAFVTKNNKDEFLQGKKYLKQNQTAYLPLKIGRAHV